MKSKLSRARQEQIDEEMKGEESLLGLKGSNNLTG